MSAPYATSTVDRVEDGTQANVAAMFDLLIEEIRELRAAVAALSPERSDALVDAETVAAVLGISRAWVYEHAVELGVIRLGDGSRPRLRFDLAVARSRFACLSDERSQTAPGESLQAVPLVSERDGRGRRGSSATRLPQTGSVLRIRPREAA